MQVKQRLRLNSVASTLSVVVILLVSLLAASRVYTALESSRIADAIMITSFERLILRTDLHRTGHERTMIQLIAKHKVLDGLLNDALAKFSAAEDQQTIRELLSIHETIGKYSKTIWENREKLKGNGRGGTYSAELEDRLLSQLNMRVYESILLNNKLQESSNRAVSSAVILVAGGILLVLILVSATTLINSWSMGRMIADRIGQLRDGAAEIGGGNLEHRIVIKGDDEFTELSQSFNAMTEKLHGLYRELEKEIEERKLADEALREGEERLRFHIEHSPLAVIEWNADFVATRWAGEAERMFGWSATETVGKAIADLNMIYEEDIPAVQNTIARLTDGMSRQVVSTNRNYTRDGAVIHCIWHNTIIVDAAGRMTSVLSLVQDITDRVRAEQRLDLLAQTAGSLLASDSPQEVVDALCQKVMTFLDCHTFINFIVSEQQGRLHLNACAGISAAQRAEIEWLDFGVAVCGCAARDACRIVAEDISNTPDPRTELVKSYGILAYACHPLLAQGRVLGTLSFGSRTRTRFSDDDLAMMKAVADQVAIALERQRGAEELRHARDQLELRVKKRTEELATTVESLLDEMAEREQAEGRLQRLNSLYAVLSETDQAIIRVTDRESLYLEFCRIAVEHGGFLLAWIGLLDEQGDDVRVGAASGATTYLDEIRITTGPEPEGEGPTVMAIRKGTYHVCNDFQHDPCTRPWHERGRAYSIYSSAAIALKENDRVIGALTLYAGEPDFFDQQHVTLLQQMGADISFALDNFTREAQRRETEAALREETLERLRVVERLREKEQMLIQQNRLAAMGEMMNNIAHQWRQPLNMLGLNIQRLAMFYGTDQFDREFLLSSTTSAMNNIRHMSRTIDDFRNFFKTEREKSEFSVSNSVLQTISLVNDSFKEDRIEIVTCLEDDLVIFGHPNEFSQVLLNILQNSRDAIRERQVENGRVTITSLGENDRAIITISDNAGGIDGAILDRIFEPYFSTKGVQGTGIGLFMSKNIIENSMGGSITACNIDAGSEFRIEI
jgi:PAS domain S-box-containing protein